MFYLTKRTSIRDCKVGDECMVLADFSGLPAGSKGRVERNYGIGVMIRWDGTERSDGFNEDELEYLRDGMRAAIGSRE
jgi:hypothetical protein